MKIELLQSRASADGVQNRGDVIDVPVSEAERMIAAGQAVPVRSKKKPEKAVPKITAEKARK